VVLHPKRLYLATHPMPTALAESYLHIVYFSILLGGLKTNQDDFFNSLTPTMFYKLKRVPTASAAARAWPLFCTMPFGTVRRMPTTYQKAALCGLAVKGARAWPVGIEV
jgi:hypothetical protein